MPQAAILRQLSAHRRPRATQSSIPSTCSQLLAHSSQRPSSQEKGVASQTYGSEKTKDRIHPFPKSVITLRHTAGSPIVRRKILGWHCRLAFRLLREGRESTRERLRRAAVRAVLYGSVAWTHRAQSVTSHLLEPANSGFSAGSCRASRRYMPIHSPMLDDKLKMVVLLRGCTLGGVARYGRGVHGHDNRRFGMTFGDSDGDALLVVGVVDSELRPLMPPPDRVRGQPSAHRRRPS